MTARRLAGAAGTALLLGWRAAPGAVVVRVVLTLVAAVVPPATAWFGKLLVDELALGTGGQLSRVTLFALLGASIAALGLLVGQVMTYVVTRHEAAVTLHAESGLFRRVCSFVGMRYFEDPEFQDRLMLAEHSAAEGPSSLTDFVLNVVRSVLLLATFLAVVVVAWPVMAVLLLVAAVPGLVAEMRLANRHADAGFEVSALERRRFFYRSMLTDDRAAKEVRLFGLGSFFLGRQLKALRGSQDVVVRLAARTAVVQATLSLFGAVLAGAGVVVVARGVMRGESTPGDVLLFMTAVAGVQGALSQVVAEIGRAGRSLKLFGRFLDVMRTPPDLPAGGDAAGPLRRSLRFEDVWFRYTEDGPWVLRGVSFEVTAGTALGLVGLNGAGKSTVVKLVCRFYDPDRGRILWDGHDLRDLDPDSLRARLAVTFQDFMTYDLPVGQNIGLGDLARIGDVDAIRRAAERSDIHDAISRFPRGYDTQLSRMFVDEESGEPGVTLSGGQWQRVALARSLMRGGADLLILDEPSSGLDAEAEHRIHRTLQEFRRGRTSLLISHRLGSVREADHIVVLDGGEVTEEGAHDDLVAADGVYARMFRVQASGYQDVVPT